MTLKITTCKLLWTQSRIFSVVGRPRQTATTTTQASNPFPFPSNSHPTPHQIFHLPLNASQDEIKARYFDLVRIYHPDKITPSLLSPDVALVRFQSITAAYDILREKAPRGTPLANSSQQKTKYPPMATWRARSKREALYSGGDERWKDRIVLAGVIATIVILVAQMFTTKRQALAEAVARNQRLNTAEKKQTAIALTTLHPDDPDRRLSV